MPFSEKETETILQQLEDHFWSHRRPPLHLRDKVREGQRTEGLKIPFALKDGIRKGEDEVHEAIREAFANTLIHADYRQKCRVLVVKRPDMLGFQNPGMMRIPIELALEGDEPDARNKRLAHLFGFVGIGEKAGTGIPKIVSGWRGQHWRKPSLTEVQEPSPRTILRLQMLDLFPEGTLKNLELQFGEKFSALDHPSRTALAITLSEGRLTHSRLVELLDIHASDATKTLRDLVAQDYLVSSGKGRATVYRFQGVPSISPKDVFDDLAPNSPNLDPNSPNLDSNSPNLDPNSSDLEDFEASPDRERDEFGRKLSPHLPAPVIDDLTELQPDFLRELKKISEVPRAKKTIPRAEMIQVIQDLCEGQFIRLNCLADLVQRKAGTLQGQYLTDLCSKRILKMAFEDNRNHPHQAYRSR